MEAVKHWDAIIIGAGIIGLALAIELNKRGLKVLVVDKAETWPGGIVGRGGHVGRLPSRNAGGNARFGDGKRGHVPGVCA